MTNKPTIYLAFTDDWELRGDGSGDIEQLQLKPLERLLTIFENHGARYTIMAEMMQQLTFRSRQDEFPHLKTYADRWDEHIGDAFQRGHDVQLHLHSQWTEAEWGERWTLRGKWSLLDCSPDESRKMIAEGKAYLENILRKTDPTYTCLAFRASYLAVAPSPHLLTELVELGIQLDVSLVGGLRVNTRNVCFDYTHLDEDFLPFYPNMADARKVSPKREPIICLPIFHFTGSRHRVIGQLVGKIRAKLGEKTRQRLTRDDPSVEIGRSSLPARAVDKIVKPLVFGKHLTADVGQLSLPLLQEMMAAIRRRAKASGLSQLPVVLTNHTKSMSDFEGFERFLAEVARAGDIRFITLTELAKKLASGDFVIKTHH